MIYREPPSLEMPHRHRSIRTGVIRIAYAPTLKAHYAIYPRSRSRVYLLTDGFGTELGRYRSRETAEAAARGAEVARRQGPAMCDCNTCVDSGGPNPAT